MRRGNLLLHVLLCCCWVPGQPAERVLQLQQGILQIGWMLPTPCGDPASWMQKATKITNHLLGI
jgi:hypothetical protein